jgi:hypothetical protein
MTVECATVSVMTDDYFAGLFDGEGTLRISFNGQQYQLLASLGMTDRRPVQALMERFGGWIEVRSNAGTGWKPVYIWRASSKGATALLDAVENSLLVKGEQARIAREFQEVLRDRAPRLDPRKRTLYERMKEANRRGIED